ncbi:MAG: AIR synthase family protein, partial [Candidatus Jordarchaeaceae archaeon]
MKKTKLPMGKIPPEVLKNVVFKHLGVKNPNVILGPALGMDSAVIKVGEKVLIYSMDPITGAKERIGWLAVNINANDVATFGIRPSLFSACILLPEKSTEKTVEEICVQIDLAAKRLGIAVIGGHSEVTPKMKNPIIVGCAMAITDPGKYVTSAGSKPGDKIILTKGAGLEGTAVIANEKRETLKTAINDDLLNSAMNFYEKISVVQEAVLAYNFGGVTAMHDPTEGGLLGGIHELADASELGVKIYKEKIYVHRETMEICRFFKIDPMQLISSGALLISANPNFAEGIIQELSKNNIKAAVIGEFTKDPSKRMLIHEDG